MSTAAVDRLPSEMPAYGNPNAVTSIVGLSVPDAAMMTALLQGSSSHGSKADILGSKADILINTMQLVEPEQHLSVPNHVLDTSMSYQLAEICHIDIVGFVEWSCLVQKVGEVYDVSMSLIKSFFGSWS